MNPRGAPPTGSEERSLVLAGFRAIAGVDEVGRGAWAGPLVAAAVILPPMPWDEHAWVADLRDSKTLTVDRRRALAVQIREAARAVGVGWVTADEIDAIGLAPANELAMLRAVRDLPLAPDFLLIDAFQLRTSAVRQRGIIHGDSRSHSIAAASIVAKVTRDDWMVRLARRHRGYGFERHKGYGVASHRAALGERGPSAIHRLSFQPVTEAIR